MEDEIATISTKDLRQRNDAVKAECLCIQQNLAEIQATISQGVSSRKAAITCIKDFIGTVHKVKYMQITQKELKDEIYSVKKQQLQYQTKISKLQVDVDRLDNQTVVVMTSVGGLEKLADNCLKNNNTTDDQAPIEQNEDARQQQIEALKAEIASLEANLKEVQK
ncbi:hypothetical protein BDF19DRAFT_439749 [Syncephalis fuscata]|nr:hypothetical protein BDF19DRAFT_439749 [Syncephalis fuscata]